MTTKLEMVSNNVHNIAKAKKLKDRDEEEQKIIVNFTVWESLIDYIEQFGLADQIESGLVILKTNDGDIRTEAFNMDGERFVNTLEEAKQRYHFNNFMGEFL